MAEQKWTNDKVNGVLCKTATITLADPEDAGENTDYLDCRDLDDMTFLCHSTCDQQVVIKVMGSSASTFTREAQVGSSSVTLADGSVTATADIASVSDDHHRFIRFNINPAATTTGTVTIDCWSRKIL